MHFLLLALRKEGRMVLEKNIFKSPLSLQLRGRHCKDLMRGHWKSYADSLRSHMEDDYDQFFTQCLLDERSEKPYPRVLDVYRTLLTIIQWDTMCTSLHLSSIARSSWGFHADSYCLSIRIRCLMGNSMITSLYITSIGSGHIGSCLSRIIRRNEREWTGVDVIRQRIDNRMSPTRYL